MIRINNVHKVYGKGDKSFTALNDVSLEITEGSTVAIVGKSGSGKSTLMHVMSGLDRITSGSIEIDGKDISTLKNVEIDRFRASTIGFIFQSFFVQGNESCYENVALPLEVTGVSGKERRERVESALERVELSDKRNQKAKNLSGGQKQRLAIARAIVNEPKILFADEPTGNLDSTTGDLIEKLLFQINKDVGSTLVIVTHDDDLASQCDIQVHIKDGSIIKQTRQSEVTT